MPDNNICPVCGSVMVCPQCGTQPEFEVETVNVVDAENEKNYEVWIDIYQGNTDNDFKVLAENGVKGVIAKAGYGYNNAGARGSKKDSLFKKNIEMSLKYGMKVAAYWWNHPTEDWNRQVDVFLDTIKGLPLTFATVDVEQSSGYVWTLNKKKNKYMWTIGQIDSSQISNAGAYMCEMLDRALSIPICVYTRTSFIMGYSQKMLEWLPKYWVWLASYPDSRVYTCDKREALTKGFTYCATWQEYFQKYAPKTSTKIALPRGVANWKLWQFSGDRVKLPGSRSYLDLNWFRSG